MPSDIILVTERERHDPMPGLIEQLRRLGHHVQVIPRVTNQALNRLPTPRVVLLDVGSREFQASGAVPAALQAAWEYVPVILAARADEVANIRFSQHLHDFISLPTTPTELDARIRFALWKTRGARTPRNLLEMEGLRMDLSTHEVWADNRRVELTYKEFELLKYFVAHPRRVFTRPELLEQVWESDYFGGTRTVDVHIRRLRAKLGPRAGNLIQTVRNVGYRFG